MKKSVSKVSFKSNSSLPVDRGWRAVLAASCLLMGVRGAATGAEPVSNDAVNTLADLDIEQLVNLTVTSVGKKEQSLASAPAAIYVLTQDDINRSGATSIPEALRLVPGLQVARADTHNWAISSRGFNDIYANKLLVMTGGPGNIVTPGSRFTGCANSNASL